MITRRQVIVAAGVLVLHSARSQADMSVQAKAAAEQRKKDIVALEIASIECKAGEVFRLLRRLKARGASVPDGQIPLISVSLSYVYNKSSQACDALMRRLIRRGAEVNAKSAKTGKTALFYAAGGDRLGLVRILLKAGARVDARGPDGTTPLSQAALLGGAPAVEMLLAAGADPHAVDCRGDTARDLAHWAGHTAVEAILQRAERQRPKRAVAPKTAYATCRGQPKRGTTRAAERQAAAAKKAAEAADRRAGRSRNAQALKQQSRALAETIRAMRRSGQITDRRQRRRRQRPRHEVASAARPAVTAPPRPVDPCKKVRIYTTGSSLERGPGGSHRELYVVMTNDSDKTVEVQLTIKGKGYSSLRQTIYVPKRTSGRRYNLRASGSSVYISGCSSR